MKAIISLKDFENDNKETCFLADIDKVKNIWKTIKKIIKNFNNISDKVLSCQNFIYVLLGEKEYSITHREDITDITDDIKYYIDMNWYEKYITYDIYSWKNNKQRNLYEKHKLIIDPNNEGNCIDNFIRCGVSPSIDIIESLMESILARLPERQDAQQYHQTACYEKDFTEISLLKKAAEKIVENCNTHLERISEFYTKLN